MTTDTKPWPTVTASFICDPAIAEEIKDQLANLADDLIADHGEGILDWGVGIHGEW